MRVAVEVDHDAGGAERDVGTSGEHGHLRGQLAGHPLVVVVAERDQLAGGGTDARVAATGQPLRVRVRHDGHRATVVVLHERLVGLVWSNTTAMSMHPSYCCDSTAAMARRSSSGRSRVAITTDTDGNGSGRERIDVGGGRGCRSQSVSKA